MSLKQILTDMLIRDEGVRLKPYRCTAGKLSIGCGRNLTDVGISGDEALYLLNHDIERVEKDCAQAFDFWATLDDSRKCVLLNMCFNLGLRGLLKFQNTLQAVKNCEYDKAADMMLDSKWASQVGERAKRLAHIMRTGD